VPRQPPSARNLGGLFGRLGVVTWLVGGVLTGCGSPSAQHHQAPTPSPSASELEEDSAAGPVVAGVVYSLPGAGLAQGPRTVLLSFDDGPNPRDTPKILAELKAAGVHALFCQVGSMTAAHPEIARAEVAAGHRVCDHTHGHPHRLASLSPQVIDDEVLHGQQEIERATGQKPTIFRSPEGSLSPAVIGAANRYGMAVYQWSIDTKDFQRPSAATITACVLDHLSPGAIVLLHDGGGNRDNTVAALPMILKGLTTRGYTAVLPP